MRLIFAQEEILGGSQLFAGIAPAAYRTLLESLQARLIRAKPGEALLLAGEAPRFIGMVFSGHAHIYRESMMGDPALIATLSKGELFAETLCLAGLAFSPMTVVAHGPCEYLRLPASAFFPGGLGIAAEAAPGKPPPVPVSSYQAQLRANLLRILAQKNLYLQSRMEILSAKGIREKVLRLLQPYAKDGASFTLPLNREQMAAYLCVDRSALSHELARMQAEGLISYQKNRFTLPAGPMGKEKR